MHANASCLWYVMWQLVLYSVSASQRILQKKTTNQLTQTGIVIVVLTRTDTDSVFADCHHFPISAWAIAGIPESFTFLSQTLECGCGCWCGDATAEVTEP